MSLFSDQKKSAAPGLFDPAGAVSAGTVRGAGSPEASHVSDGALGSEENRTYLGLAVSAVRLRTIFLCIAALFLVIMAKAADIQIARGAYYEQRAELNRSRIEPVPSERGIVFDRNGVVLVRNVPFFTVQIRPVDLPKKPADRLEIIARLAEILGLQPADIDGVIDEFRSHPVAPVLIASDVTHDQAVILTAEAERLPGVELVRSTRREYPETAAARSFAHLLGYEGRVTAADVDGPSGYLPTDFIGKAGIERSYEQMLRGTYGKRRVEIDASGRRKNVLAEEPGQPGLDLELTIDAELQRQVERILATRLRIAGKNRGTAIVLEPATGDILALVSLPAYDNNRFARGISSEEYQALIEDPANPLFPRAVAGLLPPGSTFKPVVAAAALAEELIDSRTTVSSTGGLRIGGWFFPDWKAGGHGITNVVKAIAESVNTFFYAVGGGWRDIPGLGPERIADYARRFGFGRTLGIDLPAEAAGFLPTREWKEAAKNEPWYIGDTYHMAIGQGDILATPLQIAAMTGVFASGGQLLEPRIVRAATLKGGARQEYRPEVLDPAVAPDAAIATVRQGLRQTIAAGSGRSLLDLPVAVAGKTGTAQWHSKRPTHAWFTSFAPFDDPEIVVTVVVEEGGEGSAAAAPIAKEIYAWYYRALLPPPVLTPAEAEPKLQP